jgi:hypothetical protein
MLWAADEKETPEIVIAGGEPGFLPVNLYQTDDVFLVTAWQHDYRESQVESAVAATAVPRGGPG